MAYWSFQLVAAMKFKRQIKFFQRFLKSWSQSNFLCREGSKVNFHETRYTKHKYSLFQYASFTLSLYWKLYKVEFTIFQIHSSYLFCNTRHSWKPFQSKSKLFKMKTNKQKPGCFFFFWKDPVYIHYLENPLYILLLYQYTKSKLISSKCLWCRPQRSLFNCIQWVNSPAFAASPLLSWNIVFLVHQGS